MSTVVPYTPIFLISQHELFVMATVEDALAAFPEDDEPESSRSEQLSPKVETTLPAPEGGGDRCLIAVKAAMETIGEFCGMEGFPVTLAGMNVRVPTAMLKIAQKSTLPREDRTRAIRESAWMEDISNDLCTEIRGLTPGTPEHDKCTAALGDRMTDELINRSM